MTALTKKFSQKGQSILEIIITLSILGLILGSLVIVIVNSLKNSQFSKNQSQATKLAEEGLDSVRTMKSKELCTLTYLGTQYYWVNKPSAQLVWGNSTILGTYNIDTTGCNLTFSSTPQSILPGKFFQRQIILSTDGAASNRLKITSKVTWNDISGLHESKLFTILTQ